ncbi:MAG: hypothetical protein Q8M17_16865 [Actinomycetota bacterium]|nr:hypothetical protein [Actinomycetota bacterium]
MTSLRLALKGLRWRAGSSLAVLLVAVAAVGGAALGPMYAHSAEESLVRDGLAQAPTVTTSVQYRGGVAGQTQFTPIEVRDAVERQAADPALDAWYLPGTLAMSVVNGSPATAVGALGSAQVSWHRGQCEAVIIVAGQCPRGPGEAMLSARTADQAGVGLGEQLRLGITADLERDRATVVGLYDAASADPAVWGLGTPQQFRAAAVEGQPDRLDEVLVDEAKMSGISGDVSVSSLRQLDAQSVGLSGVDAMRAAVETATAIPNPDDVIGARTVATSGLPAFLDSVQSQVDAMRAATVAVTLQLVLLAWFVLFLLVSATSEERAGEIALAKLRGMTPRSTVSFGLAEPVLLLVVAVPIGLALAWLADVFLARAYLGAGTDVAVTPVALIAAIATCLGGAMAAALAARGILTAPVLEQLRRTSGRRARLLRSSAVDAMAVALAVAGIYQLRRGSTDGLALLAPGLIALAAGLLAARALPRLARVAVSRTRTSSSVASFIAVRNIARRPSGLRIVVLLTLAIGIAVFAIDGWFVASANRGQLARAQVGSATVLTVATDSPGALLAAVDEVDPDGNAALAAVTVSNGDGGMIAVDASRLAAVSSWDPAWAGSTAADIGSTLHPPSPSPSIAVQGRLTADVTLERRSGDARVLFAVAVRDARGVPHEIEAGELSEGSQRVTADLPMCADQPCTLTALTFRQPIGIPSTTVEAEVGISAASDSLGPVDLAPAGTDGWRPGASSIQVPVDAGAAVASATAGTLDLQVSLDGPADAAVQVADHPDRLPVVQGSELAARPDTSTVVSGLDGRFIGIDARGEGVLPRLLSQGTLTDLPYALAAMESAPGPFTAMVWLGASAPPDTVGDLERAGLVVLGQETIASRSAELDRSSEALSLRLFVLAALLALALAAGTLLASAYVVTRRRGYELAALRALGASMRTLVGTGRTEQSLLAGTGVALGAAAGLWSASLAIPALLGASAAGGPPPWFGPAWVPVGVVVAGALALLLLVADAGSRRIASKAVPELLRQVQE